PQVPEGSRNPNPTDSIFNPSAGQIETLTVESPIPTVSSPVLTACLNDFLEPSSEARLVSKRVANQKETPSLDNILLLSNRFEDILGVSTSSDEIIGVEADVSNMETSILAIPTTSSIPLPSIPTTPIPTVTQPDTTPIIQYSRRARIAQSFALPTVADEPASPVRDDSQREACPTDSGFIADQDRATIAKSSTLPHDSAPRVTSPAADEGSSRGGNTKIEGTGLSLRG
nr:hypothetical protein [Tanacetum cinerariifolium]